MSLGFVPYVPVIPPSARALELGRRLADVIRDFNRQHSDVTEIEVRQALQIALGEAGGGGEKRRAIVAVAAALVAGVGLAIALAARSGPGGGSTAMPAVFGALVVFAIVVVLILSRRGG